MSIKNIEKINYAMSTNIDQSPRTNKQKGGEGAHVDQFTLFKQSLDRRTDNPFEGKYSLEAAQLERNRSEQTFAKIKSDYYQLETEKDQYRQTAKSNSSKSTLAKMAQNQTSKSHNTQHHKNLMAFLDCINGLFKNQIKVALIILKYLPASPLQNKHKKPRPLKPSQSNNVKQQQKSHTSYNTHLQSIKTGRTFEAAHNIKGWIEFQMLITSSHAFKQLQTHSKQRLTESLIVSESANSDPTHSIFSLSNYAHDSRFSAVQHKHTRNINESLVYTLDYNFEFSPKQQLDTSPQKSTNDEKQLRVKRSLDDTQSVVEVFKPIPKVNSSPDTKRNQDAIGLPETTKRNPVRVATFNQRRYLAVRTKIYELPLMSDLQFRPENKNLPKINAKIDFFRPNTPDNSQNSLESLMKDLHSANHLLPSAQHSFIKQTYTRRPSAIVNVEQSLVNQYNIGDSLPSNGKPKPFTFLPVHQQINPSTNINRRLTSPKQDISPKQDMNFNRYKNSPTKKSYYAMPQPASPIHITKEKQSINRPFNYLQQNSNTPHRLTLPQRYPPIAATDNRSPPAKTAQTNHLNPSIKREPASNHYPPLSHQIYPHRSSQIKRTLSPTFRMQQKQRLSLQQLDKQQQNQFPYNNTPFDHNYYATANSIQPSAFPKTYSQPFQPTQPRTVSIFGRPPISQQSAPALYYHPSTHAKGKSLSIPRDIPHAIRNRSTKSKITLTLKHPK